MKFIGGEDWKSSFFYWIMVLVAGFILTSIGFIANLGFLTTLVVLAVAVGIAMHFYDKEPQQAVIIVAVGMVADIVIFSVIGGAFFFAFLGVGGGV